MKNQLKIRQLTEERAQLVTQMRASLSKAETEKRGLTPDEDSAWQQMASKVDGLKTEIEREQRQTELDAEIDALNPDNRGAGKEDRTGAEADEARVVATKKTEARAFDKWMRRGISGLQPEERALMERRLNSDPEVRAQGVGTDSAGGYLVPEDFFAKLEVAMTQWGGMRKVNTMIMRTSTGAVLPMPTTNDTAQSGELLAENNATAEQDVTFGSKNLSAFLYSSKLVRVSRQLLQDSAINVDEMVARLLGERLGRITNLHYTTGDGANKPRGVVTDAALGKTGAAGQTTSVTYDDLIDLIHAVPEPYRMNAWFSLHDLTLAAVRKLKDSNGLPILFPSLDPNLRDRILTYPYQVNNDIAQMAASAKSILFGDFSKYHIRDVLDLTLLRLQERYAELMQVGFIAFLRTDGVLLDAGTNPIKYYQNAAA